MEKYAKKTYKTNTQQLEWDCNMRREMSETFICAMYSYIYTYIYIYILKNLCLNSYKQIAGTCNRLSVKTSFHHSPPICHSAQKESEQQAQAKCWPRWGEHKLVYKTSRNSHPNSKWLSLRLSACLSAHSVKWHSWHSSPKERASDHGCSIVAGWA